MRIWYGPVGEKKSTSRKVVHTFADHSSVVALCFNHQICSGNSDALDESRANRKLTHYPYWRRLTVPTRNYFARNITH